MQPTARPTLPAHVAVIGFPLLAGVTEQLCADPPELLLHDVNSYAGRVLARTLELPAIELCPRHDQRTGDASDSIYAAREQPDLMPQARGKGHGRALMEAFRSALRALGVPGVHLATGASNASAQLFYRRVDFVPFPEQPLAGAVLMGSPT